MLPDLFKKARYVAIPYAQRVKEEAARQTPDEELLSCAECGKHFFEREYLPYRVCPRCGYHSRLGAYERIHMLCDENSFIEHDAGLRTENPINFEGYSERIDRMRKETGLTEALVTGKCAVEGADCLVAVMDSRFLMASMGSVVGEKLTRLFLYGEKEGLPVVIFTASGGARMQEGIISLMQMAKVAGAAKRHGMAGGLYITVLTDPTTGGVTASFAMLGDIILAEPGATVGFAGRRVIEATIGQKLPENFQSSEFQMEHGFVDAIVGRRDMRSVLGRLLSLHAKGGGI